jgi:hypothetical protein
MELHGVKFVVRPCLERSSFKDTVEILWEYLYKNQPQEEPSYSKVNSMKSFVLVGVTDGGQ